ncbi:MAG: hypothetical protein QXW35_04425 [Candidatus Aenigmatarchaeota archaeon]
MNFNTEISMEDYYRSSTISNKELNRMFLTLLLNDFVIPVTDESLFYLLLSRKSDFNIVSFKKVDIPKNFVIENFKTLYKGLIFSKILFIELNKILSAEDLIVLLNYSKKFNFENLNKADDIKKFILDKFPEYEFLLKYVPDFMLEEVSNVL